MTGKLTVVIGPMFAGKTTELQRRVKREIHACRRVCIIRYGKDDRYSKSLLATHDQSHIKPTFSVEKLSEVGEKWIDYDTIAVDEGQFFPDLVEFCQEVTDAGRSVIVVGLDGDFRRRPFGKICDLVPLAEEVVKITAVCMACHERDAHFTRRTVASDATELIGGADMYIAVCRECYLHPAPPTPGRVNRYRENVKEVERMCLRGHRTSADMKNGGSKSVAPSQEEEARTSQGPTHEEIANSKEELKQALRRSRSQNQQQPGSKAPNVRCSGAETDNEYSNLQQPTSNNGATDNKNQRQQYENELAGSPHLPPLSPQASQTS